MYVFCKVGAPTPYKYMPQSDHLGNSGNEIGCHVRSNFSIISVMAIVHYSKGVCISASNKGIK